MQTSRAPARTLGAQIRGEGTALVKQGSIFPMHTARRVIFVFCCRRGIRKLPQQAQIPFATAKIFIKPLDIPPENAV